MLKDFELYSYPQINDETDTKQPNPENKEERKEIKPDDKTDTKKPNPENKKEKKEIKPDDIIKNDDQSAKKSLVLMKHFSEKILFQPLAFQAVLDALPDLKHTTEFKTSITAVIEELKKLGKDIPRPNFDENCIHFDPNTTFGFIWRAIRSIPGKIANDERKVSHNSLYNLCLFAKLVQAVWSTAYTVEPLTLEGKMTVLSFPEEYTQGYILARKRLVLLQCNYFQSLEEKENHIPDAIKILDEIFLSEPEPITAKLLWQLTLRCHKIVSKKFPQNSVAPVGYLSFLIQPHEKGIKAKIKHLANLAKFPDMADKNFALLLASFLFCCTKTEDKELKTEDKELKTEDKELKTEEELDGHFQRVQGRLWKDPSPFVDLVWKLEIYMEENRQAFEKEALNAEKEKSLGALVEEKVSDTIKPLSPTVNVSIGK